MSSRNVDRTQAQRAAAPVLQRALHRARLRWAEGERDAAVLRETVRSVVATQSEGALEYVRCADDDTLTEREGPVSGPVLLSLVVRFGGTRLLDNTELAQETALQG